MATQSSSTTTGVGSSSAPTILEVLSTTRNPDIWKHFNLCKMSDNSTKAQCKRCFGFLSSGSNSTLKNHINHPHCEALKTVPKAVQSSMSRNGSVFMLNLDVLRKQFAGLVIQRGLPFNHFDDDQTTRVFQNHLQPKYNHVSHTTLKRDAMKLWVAAKQVIINGFLNLNVSVNITTDVWSAPHGLPGSYLCVTAHWIEPNTWQMMKRVIAFEDFPVPHTGSALAKMLRKAGVELLIETISMNLEVFDDGHATKAKQWFDDSLEGFDVLGFWKAKESMFHVLSRMAMDLISIQTTSVAFESAFSTSGRVLSIRRTRLTPGSLEKILDAEGARKMKSIALTDDEIALDDAIQSTRSNGSGFQRRRV
ncbi:zinc finger BED domain-containing protein RICESLEEPER 2-like protein [Tanacetum coccineum]